MLKLKLFSALSLLPTVVFAVPPKLPDSLVCKAKILQKEVTITITGINSPEGLAGLKSDILDADDAQKNVDNYSVTLGFSNFCDNQYNFTFVKEQLFGLEKGHLKTVNAFFHFDYADYAHDAGLHEDDDAIKYGSSTLATCQKL